MPAQGPPKALQDFLKAYADGVVAGGDGDEDARRGSGYDLAGGVSAICWARQARRDGALFRNAYFETATGEDLERHGERRYGVPRTLDTAGAGVVTLVRPSAGVGAGTLYAGTRIEVLGGAAPVGYPIAVDTLVAASALSVDVPIRAPRTGTGTSARSSNLRLGDIVFDSSFVPTLLVCGDGTDLESPSNYRARARAAKRAARPGYSAAIVQACVDAGAVNIVPLASGALGPALDTGLSYIYVGDASFSTPAALLKACRVALDAVGVAGCSTQVLSMQQAPLSLTVACTLWAQLSRFNLLAVKQAIVAALLAEFAASTRWWTFRLDALQGAAKAADPAIQSATVTSSPGEPALAFPLILTRYSLAPSSIALTVTGPS